MQLAQEYCKVAPQLFLETSKNEEENEWAYKERVEKLGDKLKEAKVNFLKEELNYERILESLPPLVPASRD